jgi:YD repeat-containing protein
MELLMLTRRAVKILHSFTGLFSKSGQATSKQPEPRIHTDATDHRGLSATIRRIRQNPRFRSLQSCLSRFSVANLIAHARRARNASYVANATPARRLICFIVCFSLILSSQPVFPAGMSKAAEKSKAQLTQGPPGLNLPNLNEARRMSPSAPKIASPVSAASASNIGLSAPAPLSMQDNNWPMALINRSNRVGTSREDLLSRNFNWGVPLVSLSGRAGMDLNLGLSLNSLIWTKSGTKIYFNLNQGLPSPGFHLGFPELGTTFYNPETGTDSVLLTMPSGQMYEFRRNPAYNPNIVYEEMGSTHMLLVVKINPNNELDITWTLLLTDGSTYKFKTVVNNFKCVEIKDRNGNYISVAYTPFGQISDITETLGRIVRFNYDGSNRLTSITQNWGSGTHTYATFTYDNVTIQTNFPGLDMVGATNGTTISALSRVNMADGKVYAFEYNTYAQVRTIRCFAPNSANPGSFPDDYTLLSSISYDLPPDADAQQSDCPRFSSRTDWAKDWNDGVITTYAGDGATWGSATAPDGTVYKEFFGASGWQRGLTLRTETWANDSLKKWTTATWVNGNPNVSYWLNPRVIETNVHDNANGSQKRTTMDYADFGVVSDIREYDANTSTVLRHTHLTYLRATAYTGNLNRRLTQLVTSKTVYDGAGALHSKFTYEYDLEDDPEVEYLVHQGPPIRHDTAKFGLTFVQGRGNLNRIRRWAVDNINESVASTIGYNTSGSMIFSRDPLNHPTSMSYTDSFSDSVNRNTLAYPTTITDADTHSSTIQYHYDFGAVTRTEDPKGAAVVNSYDPIGRLSQATNEVNGAYTRYVYAPNHLSMQSFTTINDSSSEFYQITVSDGHGRKRCVASDHPGSVGGYKAQNFVYDIRGRLVQQTNPTEIDVDWEPAGDDAAGFVWSSQTYDWQDRVTDSTDQAGKTKEFLYDGCGCAGAQVVVTRDEVGRRQKMTYDNLGRLKTTQVLFIQPKDQFLNGNGAVYSTTTNTYNVRDQVTNVNVKDEASGVSQNTQMVYDGHGRLKERWLPIYLGNPQSETPFDSYEYYNDDTLMSETDPRGASATHSYNNRHLVTSTVYSAPTGVATTPNVTFAYDKAGNRTWMDDGPGHVSYVYDISSRLQSETRHFDDLTGDHQISYTYNLAGVIKTITDNRLNTTATYTYNKAGQLTGIAGNGYGGSAQNNITASSDSIWYRAWGGTRQLNYGNGLQLNLSYNERLQPTQYRLQTGQSQLRDGSDYQYYDDGRVKFASNMVAANEFVTPANAFDRAYAYDHAGRLVEASTGPEARGEVLPPSPPPPNNPYKQVNTYDAWGNLTLRANRFWRTFPNDGALYSNNRRGGWQYDQAGNVLSDSNVHTYDAASRQATMTGGGIVGGGLTGHPQMPATEIAQSYDGDGSPVKRIETRRTEEYIDGGPQTEITTSVSTTYYVRPRALGGQVMLEIEPIGDIIVNRSYIYIGNERIAECASVSVGGQTSGSIEWRHSNPVTGTLLKSHDSNFVTSRSEFDPFGAEVGNSDPYFGDEFADYIEIKGQEPLYIEGGDPFDLSGGCSLDGMPVPCSFAMAAANKGSAVEVPDGRTIVPTYGKISGKFAGYRFFDPNTGDYEPQQQRQKKQQKSKLVPPEVGVLVAEEVVAAAVALVAAIVFAAVMLDLASGVGLPQGSNDGEDRENRTPYDLYVFKSFRVREYYIDSQGVPHGDITKDQNDDVAAQSGPFPQGKSFWGDPDEARLNPPIYRIPKGSILPIGTALIADGKDVNPNSPHRRTHHTLYPIVKMPFNTFNTLVLDFIQDNAIPYRK